MTRSFATLEESSRVVLPPSSPASLRALRASSWVLPSKSGTLTVADPVEKWTVTVVPGSTFVPFDGSVETARPALTVSLATSSLANFRPASSMVFLAESSSWPATSGTSTLLTVALGVGVG